METICPNCGKHDTIYQRSGGALVCRACFVTETFLGSWVEWLPMPPERGYGREDYIDEAYCALCGLRTDFGPCPQGCPSEFETSL